MLKTADYSAIRKLKEEKEKAEDMEQRQEAIKKTNIRSEFKSFIKPTFTPKELSMLESDDLSYQDRLSLVRKANLNRELILPDKFVGVKPKHHHSKNYNYTKDRRNTTLA